MNNNSWFKKEKPMLTLPGLGGGSASNLYWSTGDGPSYTYVDDVFSMFLYKGTGSAQTINNGIKLSNADAGNSVDFNGSGDYLTQTCDAVLRNWWAQAFTIEYWIRADAFGRSANTGSNVVGVTKHTSTGETWSFGPIDTGEVIFYYWNGSIQRVYSGKTLSTGQWYHLAFVYDGSTGIKIFVDGTLEQSATVSGSPSGGSTTFAIGRITNNSGGGSDFNGRISNLRITHQSLYTSNFTPSTEALTTTSQSATASNVKLLCCNSSIITSGTVTPDPIVITGGYPKASYGPFTASDGEGGMVWIKSRTSSQYHSIIDTERGPTKAIFSNHTMGEDTGINGYMSSFHNNGFTTGNYGNTAQSNQDFISWTWRKAPGFFDVVAYTGDGSASRQISHSLGSIPGMVIVKNIDSGYNWTVWHKSEPTKYAKLNDSTMFNNTTDYFGNSSGPITPTSTYFTVNGNAVQNGNGVDYIAYVYAGGQSTESTAKCVDFNGNNEIVYLTDSTFNIGTSDYTVECWIKLNGGNGSLNQNSCLWTMDNYNTSGEVFVLSSGRIGLYSHVGYLVQSPGSGGTIKSNQWHHIAVSRSSGTVQLFVDGVSMGSASQNSITANSFYIGCERASGGGIGSFVDGKISNLRVVKGTALYTESFRPPTKVLTNITNTVLLCCNASTATGATVAPSTISVSGTPTGEVDSPFDDPDGFKFGSSEEEGVIKCDSFIVPTGGQLDIELGWEPQWWLWKKSSSSGGWGVYDAMRGVSTGGDDQYLELHNTNTESQVDVLTFNPTGVRINLTSHVGSEFVFMAVRRPDGYVGKPPTLGADVFNVIAGTSSSNPTFRTGFPVDFAFQRKPEQTQDWYTGLRLTGDKNMRLNTTAAETTSGSSTTWRWDFMYGWHEYSADQTANRSWMWKRHAGLDVVTYTGDSNNPRTVFHSLSKEPEMIWLKRRSTTDNWLVGVNFGSSNYDILKVNLNDAGINLSYNARFMSKPTSTAFTIDQDSSVNGSGDTYLAILFASVEGISKCGYYTGNGSSTGPVITLGFKPKLIIIKRTDSTGHWVTYDTHRGLGGTGVEDIVIFLNSDGAQTTGYDYFDMVGSGETAGFQHIRSDTSLNATNGTYIYYAHA
tara:strand:- start:42 stop:3389 length:3348 start_codon:yes stop_codon:yes gene_type:complete